MPSFSSQKPKSKEKSERDRLEPHQKTQKKRDKETEDRGRPQKSRDGITPGAKRVPTTSPGRPRKDPRKPRPPRTPTPPPPPPPPPPQPTPPPNPPTTTSSGDSYTSTAYKSTYDFQTTETYAVTSYPEVPPVKIKSNDTRSFSGIESGAIPSTFEVKITGKSVTATVTATVNTNQVESFISKELADELCIKSKGVRKIRTFYDSSGAQCDVKDRIKANVRMFGSTVEDHCLYIVPGTCSNHVVLGTGAWDKVRNDIPDASQQEKTHYSSHYSQQSLSLPMRGAATPLTPEIEVPSPEANYSQSRTHEYSMGNSRALSTYPISSNELKTVPAAGSSWDNGTGKDQNVTSYDSTSGSHPSTPSNMGVGYNSSQPNDNTPRNYASQQSKPGLPLQSGPEYDQPSSQPSLYHPSQAFKYYGQN